MPRNMIRTLISSRVGRHWGFPSVSAQPGGIPPVNPGPGVRPVQDLLGWYPDQPQSVPDVTLPTSFGTEWFVDDLASFLNAVNNSVTGDLITVDHTAPRIQGPVSQEIAWPAKAGAGPGNFVTIRTDAWASLPALPANGRAPLLLADGSNNPRVHPDPAIGPNKLARFRVGASATQPVGNRPFLRMTRGSGGLYLWGLDVDCAPDATSSNTLNGILRLGENTNDPGDPTQFQFQGLADLVHDVVVQQCYIHSNADGSYGNLANFHGCGSALYTTMDRCAVVNSLIIAEHQTNAECKGILIIGGRGPGLVDNNLIVGNGENLFMGGSDLPNWMLGLVPSDHTWTRNHVYKPDAWMPGTPGYGGTSYGCKNCIEVKQGKRVLIEGNVVSGNVNTGQSGQGISFKTSNQSETQEWAETGHVTCRRNYVHRVGSGYVFSMLESGSCTGGGGIPVHHVLCHDNLTDFRDAAYSGTNRGMYQAGGCTISSRNADPSHIALVNETFLVRSTTADLFLDGSALLNLTVDSCVFSAAPTGLTIKKSSIADGDASLNSAADPATVSVLRNAFIGRPSSVLTGHPGNYFPGTDAVAGLNADGSLAVGSPLKAGGAMDSWDGSDLGCDLVALAAQTAGVDRGDQP